MGVQILTKQDFEADDILATLAARAPRTGSACSSPPATATRIQLVTDDVTVLYPNVRGVSELKTYDADAVRERYGIEPAQYPEIAALVGETSDNLIGIDKVGEKTAVKWIQQYGTVDDLLAHADEITGVVGQNLRDQRDRAIRNRRLNALLHRRRADVRSRPTSPASRSTPRPCATCSTASSSRPCSTGCSRSRGPAEDQALLEAPTATDLDGARRCARSPATRSPHGSRIARDTPVGVRLATLNGRIDGVGLATQTEIGRWCRRPPDVDAALDGLARSPTRPSSCTSRSARSSCCAVQRIELGGVVFDTLPRRLAAAPVAEGRHAVARSIYYYLGETLVEPDPNQLVPATEAVEPGHRGLVHRAARRRSAGQARRGLARGLARHRDAARAGARRAWSSQGVTVSAPVLAELNARLGPKRRRDRPARLRRDRPRGEPRLTEAAAGGAVRPARHAEDARQQDRLLDRCRSRSPISRSRTRIRSWPAAASIGMRPRSARSSRPSRRPSAPTAASTPPTSRPVPPPAASRRTTRTCRTSRSRPRSAARCARRSSTGEGFETLLTADYSQIEMRIMAHLSEDEGLIEAFHSGEDLHRFVGARVFGVDPADVTPTMRTKVKAMSYGLAYGLQPVRPVEAAAHRDERGQAAHRRLLRPVRRRARLPPRRRRSGEGGRLHHDDLRPAPPVHRPRRSSNRVLRENAERQALNSPIQGSAADIIKRAMLGIDADIRDRGLGSRMLLQVHDELVLEVAPGESDELDARSSATGCRCGRAERPARRADRARCELGRSRALTAPLQRSPRVSETEGGFHAGTDRRRRLERRIARPSRLAVQPGRREGRRARHPHLGLRQDRQCRQHPRRALARHRARRAGHASPRTPTTPTRRSTNSSRCSRPTSTRNDRSVPLLGWGRWTNRETTAIDAIAEDWVDTLARPESGCRDLDRHGGPPRRVRRSVAGRPRDAHRRDQKPSSPGSHRADSVDDVDRVTQTDLLAELQLSVESYEAKLHLRDLNVHRLAGAGDPRDVRPDAARDDRPTGRRSPRSWATCPARSTGYIETLRQGIAEGVVPARRQVARRRRAGAQARRSARVLRRLRRRGEARGRQRDPGVADRRPREGRGGLGRRLRRARRLPRAPSSPRPPPKRMPSAASCTPCIPGISSAPRSTSTRPTSGASKSSRAWSTSRRASPARSSRARSVEEAIAFLDADASRKLHGTDELQRWMQALSDRAVDELSKTHFDIPDPIRKLECMIAPDERGRHLLHGPERRLLALGPDVVERARGRHRVRHLARDDDGLPRGCSRASPAARAGGLQPRAAEHLAPQPRRHERSRRGLGAVRRAADGGARLPRRPGRPARACSTASACAPLASCSTSACTSASRNLDGTASGTPTRRCASCARNVNMNDEFVRFEVNRYLGWPGQAPSYKVGQRIWEQIRDAAQTRDGSRVLVQGLPQAGARPRRSRSRHPEGRAALVTDSPPRPVARHTRGRCPPPAALLREAAAHDDGEPL